MKRIIDDILMTKWHRGNIPGFKEKVVPIRISWDYEGDKIIRVPTEPLGLSVCPIGFNKYMAYLPLLTRHLDYHA